LGFSLDALLSKKEEIEKLLRQLEEERKTIEEKLAKIKAKEDEFYRQATQSRDPIEASKAELMLHKIAELRKKYESRLEEVKRKIRGAERELEEVKMRIEIVKPKTVKWVVEYEKK